MAISGHPLSSATGNLAVPATASLSPHPFWSEEKLVFRVLFLTFAASPLQDSLCVIQVRSMLVAALTPVNPHRDFFLLASFIEASQLVGDSYPAVAGRSPGVEKRGLEPLTSCLQSRRSTS